jgi:hypothetical protein
VARPDTHRLVRRLGSAYCEGPDLEREDPGPFILAPGRDFILLASDHPKAATLSIPVLVSGESRSPDADAVKER